MTEDRRGYEVTLTGLARVGRALGDIGCDLRTAGDNVSLVPSGLPRGAFGELPESELVAGAHYRLALKVRESADQSVADLDSLNVAVLKVSRAYERVDTEGAKTLGG